MSLAGRLNIDLLRQRLRQPLREPAPDAAPTGRTVRADCDITTVRYEATHQHAGIALERLHDCRTHALTLLTRDSSLADFDFRRALFLDTETNGLAGGAGTYAFLVGVAYWEDGAFHVRQFFMPHPAAERALLDSLAELLERYDQFVTFNGKTFDLPILETRYILARQPRRLRARLHLDLLHPARRLWRMRLDSCSLGSLERQILGIERSEEDVPGYLIPYLYNRFLRDGDRAPLEGVFYHNHQDLLSLASLAVYMTGLCTEPQRPATLPAEDWFALGRLYDEAALPREAEQCYRCALDGGMPLALRHDATLRLARLLKRAGAWEDACALWRSIIGQGNLAPYLELAKFHEHRGQDLAAAEAATRAALRAARSGDLLLSPSQQEALLYRLARVQAKRAATESQKSKG